MLLTRLCSPTSYSFISRTMSVLTISSLMRDRRSVTDQTMLTYKLLLYLEDNECFDNQFFDERSQTCYWPDYAYLQVIHLASPFTSKTDAQNRIPGTNTSDKSNTISNQSGVDNSEAIDQFSSAVQLCSCLKAQAVLSSVGWWQMFIDTGELMKGRCVFELNAIHTKAYESQNSQIKKLFRHRYIPKQRHRRCPSGASLLHQISLTGTSKIVMEP